jgi:pimeloyl-ACP methyl ester carboxylesterase
VHAAALAAFAFVAAPAQARAASHLYVLLGFGNLSPGLSDFGARIGHRGVPTTVGSYLEWPAFAAQAIEQYRHGRLRKIMIVGHSLGGSAAHAMATELGRHHVPVSLVVTLDPVGGNERSKNERRSVTILPKGNENHFSMIAAHARDLRAYVLGGKSAPAARAHGRTKEEHAKAHAHARRRAARHAQANLSDRFNGTD